jgi:hypothetical protein
VYCNSLKSIEMKMIVFFAFFSLVVHTNHIRLNSFFFSYKPYSLSFWVCDQLYSHQSDQIIYVSINTLWRENEWHFNSYLILCLSINEKKKFHLFYHDKSIRSKMCVWQALIFFLITIVFSWRLTAYFLSSLNNDKFFVISRYTLASSFYWWA